MKNIMDITDDSGVDAGVYAHLPFLAKETYTHDIEIYLKDSNAYGNTYFSRYLEWQGVCREAWFYNKIDRNMLQSEGVFLTKVAHSEYQNETFPFHKIRCYLNTYNVKKTSFFLRFKFFDQQTEELVTQGYQKIAFVGHDKKPKRLPVEIIDKINRYKVDGL